MPLEDQLDQWAETGRYDKIIEALEAVPPSDLDFHQALKLGLAYNNSDRLEDSINLLRPFWDLGEDHPVWNYFLGYALTFSGHLEEARTHLLRARELHKGVPAEAILHHSICYDGDDTRPDNTRLTRWVCNLLDGQMEGDTILLPDWNLRITPWFGDLGEGDRIVASVYFNIRLHNGATLFECCTGLGNDEKAAITLSLGSFYRGIYSALCSLYQGEPLDYIQDSRGRRWVVHGGDITSMGMSAPRVGKDHYWNLFQPDVAQYLGNQRVCYIKVFQARHEDTLTAECRVDDAISRTLSSTLHTDVSQWQNQDFASHKQFFFLVCEETQPVYPYTGDDIYKAVKSAVNLFVDPDMDYHDIPLRLAEILGDSILAEELHAFIPEILATWAFEKILPADEISLTIGDSKVSCTPWQITSYHLIGRALDRGFNEKAFPENAFRICVGHSSIYNVICNVKEEKGEDLAQRGATVNQGFMFSENYVMR